MGSLLAHICLALVPTVATATAMPSRAAASATPSGAIAPVARSLADLVQRGYMVWDDRSAMVLYETRRLRSVDNALVLKARGLPLPVAPELSAGLKQATSQDDVVRAAANPASDKWLAQLRAQAGAAKGVAWSISCRAGAYDVERQFFPMRGEPGFGAKPNFPDSGSCAGAVDAIKTPDPRAQPGRQFCLYATNINLASYRFEVKDPAAAQKFAHRMRSQRATVFPLAEFDGPSHGALPDNEVAGLQPVRVTGMHAVDNQGQIIASSTYPGEVPAAVHRGPSSRTNANSPGSDSAVKAKPALDARPMPPAPLLPTPTESAAPARKKPIVIEVSP